jgi:precorrin-6A/cobalt-precorrin-6A reductase
MLRKVLILGGTGDACDLANQLVAMDLDVTTSLAGVTSTPQRPLGKIRTGGFGGPEGLRAYLIASHINILIDATHPFAENISANAMHAVAGLDIMHLRLDRPEWKMTAGDNWLSVSSCEEAARAIPVGSCTLVTIGRKGIGAFLEREGLRGIIRCIESPRNVLPDAWELILERPPYSFDDEVQLLKQKLITHLVAKNAGGKTTYAKIEAARALHLPVVMIKRPNTTGGVSVHGVGDIVTRLI